MTAMEWYSISRRIRFRFGQNLHLGEGRDRLGKAYLGFYQEIVLQFPRPSYSHVTFTSAASFRGEWIRIRLEDRSSLGIKAEREVSSSGSAINVFFGPAFSVSITFGRATRA